MKTDKLIKEYDVIVCQKMYTTMKTIKNIGLTIIFRRTEDAINHAGKQRVVCSIDDCEEIFNRIETRYEDNEHVVEGVLFWRALVNSVRFGGPDQGMPYLWRFKCKTDNGVVRVNNARLSCVDDTHIAVLFDVEPIEEKEA